VVSKEIGHQKLLERCVFRRISSSLKEFENLFERNRIFMDRTINVGSISAEQAISYGFTGPNLRAAGVDYDVRIAQPYSSYDDFDFIIPVGTSEIPMIVLRS
jgi:NADH:ubiquinone oxidoreductase subunit D